MNPYQTYQVPQYQTYAMAPPQVIKPDKAEDWEPYREIIAEMYRNKKLKDVMEDMEKNYNFRATVRQYKGKIKAWGLDNKYTKTGEYLEVLQDPERRASPNPGGAVTSSGKHISESSLNRFKKRAEKRGILPGGSSSSSGQAADHAAYDQTYYEDSYSYYPQQTGFSDQGYSSYQGGMGYSGQYQ